jgi:putative inorganic carbon (hco3(-)) transporter
MENRKISTGASANAPRLKVPVVGRRSGGQRPPSTGGHPVKRSWDLFLLSAAGLLLVSQARIQVFLPFSVPRPALIMVVVALGIWLLENNRIRSSSPLLTDRIGQAAFLFATLAIVGAPFSLSFGSSARFLLEHFSRTFIVFLILAAVVRDFEDVRRLVGAVAVGAAVFGAMAPVGRATGASVGGYDPNDAAMFLVSALPCVIFFVIHGRRTATRILAALSVFTVIGAIAATQSRGGFIGLVAVLFFMTFLFKGVKPALRVGVVVAVMGVGFAVTSSDYWDRMQTISEFDDGYGGGERVGGRKNIWGRALEYTAQNPVTGVGINQFTRAEGLHPAIRARIEAGIGTKYNTAHSMWFQVMAELGIPGFLAFVGMFILSVKRLWRLQRTGLPPSLANRAEGQAVAGVLLASLIGVMAAGTFVTHGYSALVWGPVGLVLGYSKISNLAEPGSSRRVRHARAPRQSTRRRPTVSNDLNH